MVVCKRALGKTLLRQAAPTVQTDKYDVRERPVMLDRIEVNSHEPVARRVFRELRNAIVTMGVRPGQGLSEPEIATRLGVSRQPVREAVELAVVRRACTEMTASGMEALRANLDAQRKAAIDLDPVRFMELDESF